MSALCKTVMVVDLDEKSSIVVVEHTIPKLSVSTKYTTAKVFFALRLKTSLRIVLPLKKIKILENLIFHIFCCNLTSNLSPKFIFNFIAIIYTPIAINEEILRRKKSEMRKPFTWLDFAQF